MFPTDKGGLNQRSYLVIVGCIRSFLLLIYLVSRCKRGKRHGDLNALLSQSCNRQPASGFPGWSSLQVGQEGYKEQGVDQAGCGCVGQREGTPAVPPKPWAGQPCSTGLLGVGLL